MKFLVLLACLLGLTMAQGNQAVKLFVFTEECYESLLVKQEFGNIDCLKLTVSKTIGIAIVTFAAILKVPQILKIMKAKSTEGLIFTSFFTELIMLTITITYNVNQQNPFNLYGENVFIAIQNVIIIALFLSYEKQTSKSSMFAQIFVYLIILAVSVLQLIPPELFQYSMYINMILFTIARVPQILTNFKNSSTGQLAALTVFLSFAGAGARLLTVITEAGDDKISIIYTLESVLLNGIIFLQILMYWNSSKQAKTTPKEKSPIKKKRE